MNLKQFFLPILAPHKWRFFLMWQIPLVSALFYVGNSFALKILVDKLLAKSSQNIVLLAVLALIGIAFLQEVWCRLAHLAFISSQTKIRTAIILKLYHLVQKKDYYFFLNTASGIIISKIKSIVDLYNVIFEYLWFRLTNPLMLIIIGVASIFFINSKLFFLLLFCCLLFFCIVIKMSFRYTKISGSASDAKHLVMAKISDNITNIFNIFSFAKQQQEHHKIAEITHHNQDSFYKQNRKEEKYGFKMAVVSGSCYLLCLSAVFFYGVFLHQQQEISSGDMVYLITILYQIIHSMWGLSADIGNFYGKVGDFSASFSLLNQGNNYKLDKNTAQKLII